MHIFRDGDKQMFRMLTTRNGALTTLSEQRQSKPNNSFSCWILDPDYNISHEIINIETGEYMSYRI